MNTSISTETPGLLVLDSVVEHLIQTNMSVDLRQLNANNLWKYENGYRNQASFLLRQFGFGKYFRFLKKTILARTNARMTMGQRLRLVAAILRGYRFEPAVEFP
jgi:hypothetical protein